MRVSSWRSVVRRNEDLYIVDGNTPSALNKQAAATMEDEEGVKAEQEALEVVDTLRAAGVWQGFGRGNGVGVPTP
eukprot:846827-Pyramimonas_sp.AAC.3